MVSFITSTLVGLFKKPSNSIFDKIPSYGVSDKKYGSELIYSEKLLDVNLNNG